MNPFAVDIIFVYVQIIRRSFRSIGNNQRFIIFYIFFNFETGQSYCPRCKPSASNGAGITKSRPNCQFIFFIGSDYFRLLVHLYVLSWPCFSISSFSNHRARWQMQALPTHYQCRNCLSLTSMYEVGIEAIAILCILFR